MKGRTPAESASTVTLVMQLIHANSAGFIHGGEIMKLVTSGERSAWRKMEMIRVQTHISRTLDVILDNFEEEALRGSHPVRKRRKAA